MKTQNEFLTEIEELKSLCKIKDDKINSLETKLNWFMEQLKLSKTKKFGNYTESTGEQLNMFNEAEAERVAINPEPTVETITQPLKEKKQKRSREEMISTLPVEIIEHKIEEATCPKCGNEMHVMTEEIRKELKVIPAQIKIVEHHTFVYACRNCEKKDIETPIINAPSPKGLISKSLVSSSMMAYIMNQKFVCAMPLYRQEQELKRMDVELSRQTLSNWMINGAMLLKPLRNRLKELLIQKDVLHADETTLEVLCEPGREAQTTSYMWLYRTSGCDEAIVLYDYQEGRSGKYAEDFLKEFKGYLHTDGWGGYHRLTEQEIKLCGCWAHARRKFNEALAIIKNPTNDNTAVVGLNYCNELFDIEKKISQKNYDEKYIERQKQSQSVVDAFFEWAKIESSKVLSKSLSGTAIQYAINQEKYLRTFLLDGRIELSNNRAERSIKPFVIGRKNWIFCNTPSGAKSSAIIYSIIETAKENVLKPYEYLKYVFDTIQSQDYDVDNLLPWSEAIPEDCKVKQ